MRTIQNLFPLRLYSNKQKVFIPFDAANKKKNAAILLLGTSIEDSIEMINAPYIFNPSLFRSYYVDRNITPLIAGTDIGEEEFDEIEEAAISESIIHIKKINAVEIEFINATSTDRRYLKRVFNKEDLIMLTKHLGIKTFPSNLKIILHSSLKEVERKKKMRGSDGEDYIVKFNSYSTDDEIHVLNYYAYDQEGSPDGPYEVYLRTEFIGFLIKWGYPDTPSHTTSYIASAMSGFTEWLIGEMKKGEISNYSVKKNGWTTSIAMYEMIQEEGFRPIINLLRTGDYGHLARYAGKKLIRQIAGIYETTLTAKQKENMKSSDFGLPDERKYPMPDESHVRAAIRFFNHVDPSQEEKLARAIKRKMRDFGMKDVEVGENNRFSKYYKSPKNESAVLTEAVKHINLSTKQKNDIRSIVDSFNARDKGYIGDSDYILSLKMAYCDIIYDGNEPVGFIAITYRIPGPYGFVMLGVKESHRGKGIAKQMATKMLNFAKSSKLCDTLTWNIDYGNDASAKVAQDVGFKFFKKYNTYEEYYYDLRHIQESAVGPLGTDYQDVLQICNHISHEEFRRISFYPTYQDSPFIIKRIIKRVDGIPAGFMDLTQFPSRPKEAQITTAVDDRYRGKGIATAMLDELLAWLEEDPHGICKLIWTVHPGNAPSSKTAISRGFIQKPNYYDKYGRMIFEKVIAKDVEPTIEQTIKSMSLPFGESVSEDDGYCILENGDIYSKDMLIVFGEASSKEEKMYSTAIRRYLMKERMRTNSKVVAMYDQVKSRCPVISRTFVKIAMYKSWNMYVDLHYYHNLYIKNLKFKLDRGVNMYFDFLNRLFHNPNVDQFYTKKTVFIPVPNLHGQSVDTFTDYKKGINFFSMIARLARTNPEKVRKEWGDMDFVFMASTGYFRVDFSNFQIKTMVRLKRALNKLGNREDIIPAEEDNDFPESGTDTNEDDVSDASNFKGDSPEAKTAIAINTIEDNLGIKIDDVTPIDRSPLRFDGNPLQIMTGAISAMIPEKGCAFVMVGSDPKDKSNKDNPISILLKYFKNDVLKL